MPYLHGTIYTISALILLTGIGNIACRFLFAKTGLKNSKVDSDDSDDSVQRAGWIIGWLERLVLAIGIITHSWEVLAAVIALKTVARFKELDDQKFAEIFLVGSLFSILWAALITNSWLSYDRYFGVNLHAQISNFYEKPAETPDSCSDLTVHFQYFRLDKICGNTFLCSVNATDCISPANEEHKQGD